MGQFYVMHLDPAGRGLGGQRKYLHMHTALFDQVHSMRRLRDALAARLAESPLRFEFDHRPAQGPPATLQWEALGQRAGMITVSAHNQLAARILLLAGPVSPLESQPISAFEGTLLLQLADQAMQPAYDLDRLDARPLAVKVVFEPLSREDMPCDVAEWCLAAAFFGQLNVA